MNVMFYFDPSCPFCWISSRWLHQVSQQRQLNITWQPFSLALKNNELTETADESPHAAGHRASHRILRVIEAAATQHQADRGKLYTDFGKIKHVDGDELDQTAIEIVLGINQLPTELAEVADDTSFDATIQKSIDEAIAITGDDVGVPIIAFEQTSSKKAGFFGPVLQSLPSPKRSIELWDGLVGLATVEEFYELKRTRPQGKPDTGSTESSVDPAVC